MTFARVIGSGFAVCSLGISLVLALACSPEGPAFRGTYLSVTLSPGESAHVTLVATRAAIDEAHNGLAFRATTSSSSANDLVVVPDDATLDELFTRNYGSVSAADLDRVCPDSGECLIGVTLMQGATSASYSVRFGLESYEGFSAASAAAAELD